MARHEADREDLLAEARALSPRAEWSIPDTTDVVTAGLRRDRFVSIYFGGDPCYHFDNKGRLRRAFVDGALYRTQGTTLARLVRERTETKMTLRRTDLSETEVDMLLGNMQSRLIGFLDDVDFGRAQVVRSVADETAEVGEIVAQLRRCGEVTTLAPALPTRRS